MGRPDGWETMDDVVYVVTLLKEAGQITIRSGGNTRTQSVPAGAKILTVPAGVGEQTFQLTRGSQVVLQGKSLMDISNVCPCGLYNFNAYVGTVPPGPADPLLPDGLASLTAGLLVTTCRPQPSLGTNPPVSTTATTTSSTTGITSRSSSTRVTSTTTSSSAAPTNTGKRII